MARLKICFCSSVALLKITPSQLTEYHTAESSGLSACYLGFVLSSTELTFDYEQFTIVLVATGII